MTSPFIGKTIGDCLIRGQIGEGGGGLVFLGSHPTFGKQVVLKLLPKEDWSDEQTRLRFEREIEMSVQLLHPNIVTIYQASMDDDYYYLMMEFVDGMDLDQTLEDVGMFSCEDAAQIILQALSALEFAHEKNIIHRDIKPSNILLTRSQEVKLCDFGLAKDLTVDSDLTCTGMVFGTPNFMSPEQWQGAKDLTHRSDIYSLGATFYFMVTGKKPFEGASSAEIMTNSLFGSLTPPKEWVNTIPEALNALIETMLAREPEQRPESASQLIEDLKSLKLKKKGFLSKIFG